MKAILGQFLQNLATGKTRVVEGLDCIAILVLGRLRDAAGVPRGNIGRVFGDKVEFSHDMGTAAEMGPEYKCTFCPDRKPCSALNPRAGGLYRTRT